MSVNKAPTAKGKELRWAYKRAAATEERKIEVKKGGDLQKGEKRFEEGRRAQMERARAPNSADFGVTCILLKPR